MGKIPVPFAVISQALNSKDTFFALEVYKMLAQHILLGNIKAEDISFLKQEEAAQKFDNSDSLPIFANQEMLFSALIANATSIPFISAYQNFFNFVKAQASLSAIEMVVQAYNVHHEKIFCTMCQQFISQLPRQKPMIEKRILDLSAKYSWLCPLETRRLKYLDISKDYSYWFYLCQDIDIEIAEYLFAFSAITRNQIIAFYKQICTKLDASKYFRLVHLFLQNLQKQDDDLSIFFSLHDVHLLAIAARQNSFSTCLNILKRKNISNTDIQHSLLSLLGVFSFPDNYYDAFTLYENTSIISDMESFNIAVQTICHNINMVADIRRVCKKPMPIVKLALSTLHDMLSTDHKLHFTSSKEIIKTMSRLNTNKLYNVKDIVTLAFSKSCDYDSGVLDIFINEWIELIPKIKFQNKQVPYFVSGIIDLQKTHPNLTYKIDSLLEYILNSSQYDISYMSDILLNTPFEYLNDIPKELKDKISLKREELNWQNTFLQKFIP